MSKATLPFARAEYQGRLEKVRRAMAEARLDLLMVSSPENILWLTGYQAKGIFAFQMLLVPDAGPVRLVTRAIETGNVIAMPADSVVDEFVTYGDTEVPTGALVALVRAKYAAVRHAGVEKANMYFGVARFEAIRDGLAGVELADASHLVDRQRLVKSAAEIACFRRAAAISDAAYGDALGAVRVGATDSDVAAVIMASLIRAGSEYCAVWPNVMAGWRGGLAHAGWAGKRLDPGEPLCLEFAGAVERYHAPLYRTVIPGEPSDLIRRVAACAVRAHDAGLAAMGPGVAIDTVDRAIRSEIRAAGLLDYAHSRFGYTLGLAFPPTWAQSLSVNIVPGSEVVFEPNMLFHILVYLLEPAGFGIGTSETVLVTETGIETLTKSPKAPVFV